MLREVNFMQVAIELPDDVAPITKLLVGILKDSNVDIADYKKYLEEKYL